MLPVPIADGVLNDTLPEHTIQTARELKFFLGENAKSARAFLKFCGHPSPIASLSIEGNDIGIVSEAGCPGVADPGAQIAAEAHKLGIRVVPLVGPSSILLALMASGMDGQHFRFCGYLPIKEPARTNAIKDLERKSASSEGETQLFIETPYRNSGMLADLVKNCAPTTLILAATDISGPEERIRTFSAADWKKQDLSLPKLPTVFGILGAKRARRA